MQVRYQTLKKKCKCAIKLEHGARKSKTIQKIKRKLKKVAVGQDG
jgi:IS1 family transposase